MELWIGSKMEEIRLLAGKKDEESLESLVSAELEKRREEQEHV